MSVAIRGNVRIGSGWVYRRKVTIDYTKVTGDQTNFPILVSVSGLSNVNANGSDVRFRTLAGVELAREIESYSAGTLVAWVKIPLLSSTVNTDIWMYYGNSLATEPAANSAYGSQAVWSNGYAGVWHLKETGTNPQVLDSTANANNSTAQTWTPTTGKIGGGGSFNGSSNKLSLGSSSTLDFGSGDFSISGWFRSSVGAGNRVLLSKQTANGAAYWVYFNQQGWPWGYISSGGTTYYQRGNNSSKADGLWHHFVVVRQGSAITVASVDGVNATTVQSSGTVTNVNTAGGVLKMGTSPAESSNDFFNGTLDATRIANVARSAGWWATEYANQNSPSTFHALGSEEVVGSVGGRVSLFGFDWKLSGPMFWPAYQASIKWTNSRTTVVDTLITPGGSYPGNGAFIGGVLLPDGRVFCVPCISPTARIYNPITNTVSTPNGSYPSSGAFLGGVLLPDGRVFCVPQNSTTARIYDPITNTVSTPNGSYPGSGAFNGGVLLPDGRVFYVPYSSTTAIIYDPITNTVSTPNGSYPGGGAFVGGVLLPDGRVFCVPLNSTTARIYDPITNTVSTPNGTYPSSGAFAGGVLLPDGRVFCAPYSSTTARIYGGGGGYDINVSLSPYYNKY